MYKKILGLLGLGILLIIILYVVIKTIIVVKNNPKYILPNYDEYNNIYYDIPDFKENPDDPEDKGVKLMLLYSTDKDGKILSYELCKDMCEYDTNCKGFSYRFSNLVDPARGSCRLYLVNPIENKNPSISHSNYNTYIKN
jgi:hypothetical protein